MNTTITFDKAYEIGKIWINQMDSPIVEMTEWGYMMTDGHYTIEAELFGDVVLKENTLLGEVVAAVMGGSLDKYNEIMEFPKLLTAVEA